MVGLVFFLPPSPPFISLLCLLLCITIFVYCLLLLFSTEPLALCDGCLGWGWVWWAELMAGLRVGQAFGMFLLPGFGVGSSSPWVPGHPTSMCNAMGRLQFLEFFSAFLPPSSPFISLLCLLLYITIVVYCLLLLFSTELLTLCDGCLGWG